MNAITDLVFDLFLGNTGFKGIFNYFGEKLRYGLFSKKEIWAYELGFQILYFLKGLQRQYLLSKCIN
ncbi:hypothetical protein HNQ37_001189 [Lactovum miscens]|uniref:Uncharacterized protein n=1 Tax=Lactovum miscens TaxID=190387 RepID=A0A841C2V8_9LACT|nr:hypothetical protein [Lactovum miscens]